MYRYYVLLSIYYSVTHKLLCFFSSTVKPELNSRSMDWQNNLLRQVELQVKGSDNSVRKAEHNPANY